MAETVEATPRCQTGASIQPSTVTMLLKAAWASATMAESMLVATAGPLK